jgi:hypothetical protein
MDRIKKIEKATYDPNIYKKKATYDPNIYKENLL